MAKLVAALSLSEVFVGFEVKSQLGQVLENVASKVHGGIDLETGGVAT
jgi:hypothetical protein